jgi:2-oxoisovalerate ferredoxin oxidoreductase beta subunit
MDCLEGPLSNVAFENTGACISGMKHGLKSIGKDDVLVVGFAGDGGTADIGLQSLSGAVERGEDVIYIMYDNEAYMNTGIQRSGSTPFGAWTTTTPVGKVKAGKEQFKKDIPSIIMAHDPAYLATCSISYPMDYLRKLEKAKNKKGFRFLQVSAPCPTGWKFPTEKTIEIGKMMVESGMWTLLEYEDGVVNITKTPKMTPVKDYLMAQGRFKHMKEDEIARLQAWVNRKWELDSAKAASTQKGKEQKTEAR